MGRFDVHCPDKPECHLEDWHFQNEGDGTVSLMGQTDDHPVLKEARCVTSTPVLEWDFEDHGRTLVAYTRNTKYVLGYPSAHWSLKVPLQIDELIHQIKFNTKWYVFGTFAGIGEYGFHRWPKFVDDYGEPLPGNPWLKRSPWLKQSNWGRSWTYHNRLIKEVM